LSYNPYIPSGLKAYYEPSYFTQSREGRLGLHLHKDRKVHRQKIRTALASDFSMPLEQVVLTPEMTNMAISRKAAKTHQIYIYTKTAKYPLAVRLKKSERL
jgi:hypothetical protein